VVLHRWRHLDFGFGEIGRIELSNVSLSPSIISHHLSLLHTNAHGHTSGHAHSHSHSGDGHINGVVITSCMIGSMKLDYQLFNLLETPVIVTCNDITIITHSTDTNLSTSNMQTPYKVGFHQRRQRRRSFDPSNDDDGSVHHNNVDDALSHRSSAPTSNHDNSDINSRDNKDNESSTTNTREEIVDGRPSYVSRLWSLILQNIQLSLNRINVRIEPPSLASSTTANAASTGGASPIASNNHQNDNVSPSRHSSNSPHHDGKSSSKKKKNGRGHGIASLTIDVIESHRLPSIDTSMMIGNSVNDLSFTTIPSLQRQFIAKQISLTISSLSTLPSRLSHQQSSSSLSSIASTTAPLLLITEMSLSLRVHQPVQESLSLACPRLQVNTKLSMQGNIQLNLNQLTSYDDIMTMLSPIWTPSSLLTRQNSNGRLPQQTTATTLPRRVMPMPPMSMIRNRFPLLRVFRPLVRPFESPDAWWRYAHRAISWGTFATFHTLAFQFHHLHGPLSSIS
jgi:uncharacterized protein YejL (UPF0352 family)